MSPEIRLAVLSDLDAVESIVAAAYAHYVPRIGRAPDPMLDDYAVHIRDGRLHVLAAGDALFGLVVLIPEEDQLLLDNVAVAPEAQGRGYGRMLLDFAERTARAAGCGAVRLYTNEAMTENIALYARLGYVETHRREEKGLRRIFMTKVLT